MSSESTMDKLHAMRLSAMARACRDQGEIPSIAEMGFDERLAMIVDAEWGSRRTSKRLRYLRQANFPEHSANIADIRYDDDRGLDRAQMPELSDCSRIAAERNIIIAGASGAGKTWTSSALGGGRLQRVPHRQAHQAPGASGRAHRVQGRRMAQTAQEAHQMRPADRRRLAVGAGQAQRGAGDHGSNRGAGQDGLSSAALPVPAIGMACQSWQRRHH